LILAGSTTKKAVIRRYDREALAGYVNPVSYLQPTGVELLSAEGNISTVPYQEIKAISFVRDFDSGDEPERRVFQTRPKMEGLWVRFAFRDGDVMEGIMPNNLLQLEHYGFSANPPDPYSNTQRIFVPRTSVKSVEVLGVVGSPLKRRKPKAAAKEQIGLFEEE
jgi:Family of unknown function (DUF6982)